MLTTIAIIPIYGRDDALATVPRLLAWHEDLQIVVVDNGNASDLSAKIASLVCDRVEVVRLDENRGGSGGYIAGMKRVLERDCELVWLLDDDAEPNEGTLPGLIATYRELIERGEPVASIGSTVVCKNAPDEIVECGALYYRSPGGVGVSRMLAGESLSRHANEILSVEHCSACSCLVPRAALEKVGLWEDVFIHYDDVEWGLRAEHKFGLKNFATTRSTVKHPEKVVSSKEKGVSADGSVLEKEENSALRLRLQTSTSSAWLQYYDMYNKLWLDRMYAPKVYAKEYFIARMYALFARFFFLNRGKYYAYRLIMSDFRAGKRRLRQEVSALFAEHDACGDLRLLSLPRWCVWIRKMIKSI